MPLKLKPLGQNSEKLKKKLANSQKEVRQLEKSRYVLKIDRGIQCEVETQCSVVNVDTGSQPDIQHVSKETQSEMCNHEGRIQGDGAWKETSTAPGGIHTATELHIKVSEAIKNLSDKITDLNNSASKKLDKITKSVCTENEVSRENNFVTKRAQTPVTQKKETVVTKESQKEETMVTDIQLTNRFTPLQTENPPVIIHSQPEQQEQCYPNYQRLVTLQEATLHKLLTSLALKQKPQMNQ